MAIEHKEYFEGNALSVFFPESLGAGKKTVLMVSPGKWSFNVAELGIPGRRPKCIRSVDRIHVINNEIVGPYRGDYNVRDTDDLIVIDTKSYFAVFFIYY